MSPSGEWMLAPAYDVCYAYSPSEKWTNQHQLSLNNKRDNFTMKDLLTVANNAGIKNASIIVKQIIDVVSDWEKYAKDVNVKSEHIAQIKQTLRIKL